MKAAAPSLAGTSSAGIRIQVPGYLTHNFKLLENLGYQMRAVDPSVRRVIKFDDDNYDLMMDVKVGDSWRRIRPAEARAAKNSNSFSVSTGPKEMTSAGIADFFTRVPNNPVTGANAQPRSR